MIGGCLSVNMEIYAGEFSLAFSFSDSDMAKRVVIFMTFDANVTLLLKGQTFNAMNFKPLLLPTPTPHESIMKYCKFTFGLLKQCTVVNL